MNEVQTTEDKVITDEVWTKLMNRIISNKCK
jgi:hypothetical protein